MWSVIVKEPEPGLKSMTKRQKNGENIFSVKSRITVKKPRLELNDNNYTKIMKNSSTSKKPKGGDFSQESWSSPDKMPLVKRLLRDGLEPRFLLTQLLWQTRLALRSVLTTYLLLLLMASSMFTEAVTDWLIHISQLVSFVVLKEISLIQKIMCF